MEDTTSSVADESLETTPPAADETPSDTPEGDEQQVETKEVSTEENISDDELLAESRIGQPAQKPEEHRAKNEARFKETRDNALNRVYESLQKTEWDTKEDRKTILDKAIKSERPDIANYLRKEINRLESDSAEAETPSIDPNEAASKAAVDIRENEKGTEMFIDIVKSAGLNKKTAFAIEKRKALKSAADEMIAKNNILPTRAIRLAALELGLFDQKKLDAAKKEGAKLGRSALTPAGEVPTSPSVKSITLESLDKLASAKGKDSQAKHNAIMQKIEKGEMKIVSS